MSDDILGGGVVPADLVDWLIWAQIREVDGKALT